LIASLAKLARRGSSDPCSLDESTSGDGGVAGLVSPSLENLRYDRVLLASSPTWLLGKYLMRTVSRDRPCVRIHVVHDLSCGIAGTK
jgi:hypothetical protein